MTDAAAGGRSNHAVLAIDAGQTETKLRVSERGRSRESARPGVRTSEPLRPQLVEIVRRLHAESRVSVDVVALGVSGLTSAEADAAPLLDQLAGLGTRRVLLAHDSVSSFLGSLGSARGAVVASGTGAVTLGVGRRKVARVDGWGNIMGDAGSAYWIGREALDSVMRAHDGRGRPTRLDEVVRERWPHLEDAYVSLQSDPDRVRVVASFAAAVTELADVDAVSADISRAAAAHLADSAVTALERVDEGGEAGSESVAAIGGVFSSRLIRTEFERRVVAARSHAEIVAALGSGLDGTERLVDLETDHPLYRLISVAAVEP